MDTLLSLTTVYTLFRFLQLFPKILFRVQDPIQESRLYLLIVPGWAPLDCANFSDLNGNFDKLLESESGLA